MVEQTAADHGLGRLFAADERDHPLRAALPKAKPSRKHRYWWANGWRGDQGNQPQCVGYGWTHWLEAGPVTHPKHPRPILDPAYIYHEAQKVDEWPGEGYAGTSVRAGAKVLMARGLISEYLFAWDLETIAKAVIEERPVVVGTDWTSDMSNPVNGVIRPTGHYQGGHAYMIVGAQVFDWAKLAGRFRIINSWGLGWGERGRAWISFEDMGRLIATGVRYPGEACLAIEKGAA